MTDTHCGFEDDIFPAASYICPVAVSIVVSRCCRFFSCEVSRIAGEIDQAYLDLRADTNSCDSQISGGGCCKARLE